MENEFYDEVMAGEQLVNAMRVSDAVLFARGRVEDLLSDAAIGNRVFAIDWIKKVLQGHAPEVFECSVRIFDSYLLVKHREDPNILSDKNRVGFISAAAMVLSSKLMNSCNPINPSFFRLFDFNDLVYVEKKMLLDVGARASPLAMPSFFLPHFVRRCAAFADCDRLLKHSTTLVSEFLENARSLLFAPSTIAIAAVVVALSLQKVECDAFLNALPNYFFAAEQSYGFFRASAQKRDYLDCQACMQAMESMVSLRPLPTSSPCTVSDAALFDNSHQSLSKR